MISFKKQKQSEPIIFKGKKTVPTVGLDDPRFVYVCSIKTNLAETFRKARERMKAA